MAMTDAKYEAVKLAMRGCSGLQPNGLQALERELEGLAAEDFAKIMVADVGAYGAIRQVLAEALQARLSLELVREHVAAQKEMSEAAEELQKASLELASRSTAFSEQGIWLAVAAAFLAVVGLFQGVIQIWLVVRTH